MIACIGENLIDMVPLTAVENAPYGAFKAAPGGCPYNSAIAAARLGSTVFYIGKISNDFLGDRLVNRLAGNGVRLDYIVRAENPVTLAFVEKSASGEARYAFYASNAADRSLEAGDLPAMLHPDIHFLLLGSISLLLEPGAGSILNFAERVQERVLVSYDPNVRASMIPDRAKFRNSFEAMCARCAIVKASDADLAWIYDSPFDRGIVAHILNCGAKLVLVTQGSQGSLAATRHAFASAEAVPVRVVDTIGAGDTFHAAVLSFLDSNNWTTAKDLENLSSAQLERILRFASAAAAMDCMREGAEPPTLEALRSRFPDLALQ